MTRNHPRDVVRRVSDAVIDGDPTGVIAIARATPDELAAATRIVIEHAEATREDMGRSQEAWDILVAGGLRDGMDWHAAWKVQPLEAKIRLIELYDVLPDGLLPVVDVWRAER